MGFPSSVSTRSPGSKNVTRSLKTMSTSVTLSLRGSGAMGTMVAVGGVVSVPLAALMASTM